MPPGGSVTHQWREVIDSPLSVTDHSCVRLTVIKAALCSWEEPAGRIGWSAVRAGSSAMNLRSEGMSLLPTVPLQVASSFSKDAAVSAWRLCTYSHAVLCVQQGELGTSSLIYGAFVLIVGRQNRNKYMLCR